MHLSLYDTQQRTKRQFVPIDDTHIKMYVCGPTVYNLVHIGNARPAVVFDVLCRLLKTLYPQVTYVRNITDIDDKIMAAADANNQSIQQLSDYYAEAYADDMAQLLNQTPDIQPRATDHVPEMIAMIERLVQKQHAYEAQGHVLFAVESMPDYGKLSNRSLDDMLAGARVEVAPYKKYAGDFVLWKPSTDNEPGWESPWGRGRPGWHLECSSMIETHLGETIDIHGGGRDLIFPHHENEVAQSQCAHDGKTFVNYWLHNGYINIDGEKMSKSLGNFRMVRDLLGLYSGETLRFALLSAQYRSELNFSADLLDQAKATLDNLYGVIKAVEHIVEIKPENIQSEPFYSALLDDLNTPVAIREIHAIAKRLSVASDVEKPALKGLLLAAGGLLNILQQNPIDWFKTAIGESGLDETSIEKLITERIDAKQNKQYARADEIRQQLADDGIILEDGPDGTDWRRSN